MKLRPGEYLLIAIYIL
ncbi:uncharacterized protein FFB20_15841 [Fusarium fujikuroi]|nr:uncharacterized protein FFB20_15841 [Fusarium fujikuroi]